MRLYKYSKFEIAKENNYKNLQYFEKLRETPLDPIRS